jgi:hypothetical protein
VVGIAFVLPGGDFVDEGLFIRDTAVETLGGEDAEFGFGEVEPTAVLGRVVPFEALDQPSRCKFAGNSDPLRGIFASNSDPF